MSKNFLKRKLSKTQKLFDESLEKIIEENFPEMERVHCPTISEFKEKHLASDKPVVLSGLMTEWGALNKWDLGFFKEQCGDVEIKANLYDPRLTHDTTIKDIITRMQIGEKMRTYKNGGLVLTVLF